MFSRVKNKWMLMMLSALLVFGGFVTTTAHAETFNHFDVKLSDNTAGSVSSLDFTVNTSDSYLVSGNKIVVTMPYQWGAIPQIDKSNVAINNVTPDAVSVLGKTISIQVPASLNEVRNFEILIGTGAGLKNPSKSGNYQIHVDASLKKDVTVNDKLTTQNVSINYLSSNDVVIDPSVSAETPSSTSTTSSLATTSSSSGTQLKVMLRVGSTVGYYSKTVNGRESNNVSTMSVAPYVKNGVTLVPMDFIAKGLSGVYATDKKNGYMGVFMPSHYTEFKSGSKLAIVDGEGYTLPIAPELKSGVLMVPVRFIADHMNVALTMIPKTNTIILTNLSL